MKTRLLALLAGFCLTIAAHAAGMFVNVGGTWHEVKDPEVNVSGTMRPVQEGWVNVSGTWQRFYRRATYALPSGSSAQNDDIGGGGFAQTTLSFWSTGTYSVVGANLGTFESGNWITPTSLAPGSYTIRAHVSFGGTPNGSALDTDIPISSNPSWNVSTVGGTSLSNLNLTLKDGSGNIVATSTVGIRADA